MARVLVPLAAGFEEIETATIVDVLRRAEIEVVLAGIAGADPVRGSRGMGFVPDTAWPADDVGFDWVVLPGGKGGAEALAEHTAVQRMLAARFAAGRPIAAICAAPFALDRAGALRDGQFTCYPGWEDRLSVHGRRPEPVVDAGAVVTSQGPATALAFALHLVERIAGPTVRERVRVGLLAPPAAPPHERLS